MILYKSPVEVAAVSLCLFFYLSFSLPFVLHSSSRFEPTIPFSSLASCFPSCIYTFLLSWASRARDRRSPRWLKHSFVLSRRFQLIFIVYSRIYPRQLRYAFAIKRAPTRFSYRQWRVRLILRRWIARIVSVDSHLQFFSTYILRVTNQVVQGGQEEILKAKTNRKKE